MKLNQKKFTLKKVIKIVNNKEKILNALNDKSEINVSDLAAKSNIDIKNIGRYLKSLEAENKIIIRIDQQGKVRTKFISLDTTRKEKPTTRKEEITIEEKRAGNYAERITTRKTKTAAVPGKFNPSLELNLIKSLYANRYGSTTNKTKDQMLTAIKRAWRVI